MARVLDRTHRSAGSALLPALLLLALLLAGGGYNYRRNLQAEPPRPYRSYGDAELSQLIAAYEGDVTRREGALPHASRSASGGGPLLQDRVDDFEAAQRHGRAYREALAGVAGQEGVLRELMEERQARQEPPLSVHLRRLTTL